MSKPRKPAAERTLNLRAFLPFRLSVLSNTISRRISRLYDKEFGLSIWQWRVMATAADEPGLNATEIGERTAMDKVAVSRAIAGLIERGFLSRSTSAEDARHSSVELTREGEAVYRQIVPLALDEEARLLSALTSEERADLERLMDKLAGISASGRKLW